MEISSFPNIVSPDESTPSFYPSNSSTNTNSITITPSSEILQPSSPSKKRRFIPNQLHHHHHHPQPQPENDVVLDLNTNGSIKEFLTSFLMFDDDDSGHPNHQPHHPPPPPQPWVLHPNNSPPHDQYEYSPPHDEYEYSAPLQYSPSQQPPQPVELSAGSSQRSRKRSRTAASASGSEGTPPPPPTQRRLWVKNRSKDWWDKCSHPDFPDEEFKKSFRMSKATFNMLCDDLEPIINKKDTMLRAAIPVNQRVAVCIWRLATGEPLRLVSKRFGLGISTCHKLVLEVCSAIKTTLMSKFLQWPDDARLSAIKDEFETISGISNVGGSIYTTHIPIIAPKINVGAYFNKRHTERNQKTSYSITVQGVVDPNGVFTDVCIGWPGSMPDDKVLEKSALSQRANRGLLKNVWMVGNSSYPLTDWVLVPYTHQNLTWTQHAFNEKIGDIQKVAKDAFARLKKRWGCLQKRTEVKLQELPVLLGACCVLHNICEMRKEAIDPETDNSFELFDDEMLPEENAVRSTTAVQARDHIAHNLLHHGLAGTSFL